MNDHHRLAMVRALHPVVFAVMVTAALALLFAGVTGDVGWWLWAAMALLAAEVVALVANGFACPLSTLAVRYGADEGHVLDIFLSARFVRVTFRLFGAAAALGLFLLLLRWVGAVG